MEAILNELGLGILKETFEVERVQPEVVASLSDGNLASLGVSTIGDRIRLRELCTKSLEKSKNESDDERKNYRERVREERNYLFQPNRSSSCGRGRKRKSACPQSQRQWSFQFVCLADKYSFKTPSSLEKQMLFKAGLGLKKIKLDPNDDEDTVKEKITSDAKDSNGNTVGFPALRSCGGFELMQSSPNCRDLRHIDCCWSAKDLKAILGGGQGKIYIVPIQKSLSTKPSQKSESSSLKEECHICHKQILIRELRKHLWNCQEGSRESDGDEIDLMQSAFNTYTNQDDIIPSSATLTLAQPLGTTTSESQDSSTVTSAPNATTSLSSNSTNALVVSNSDDDKMTVDEVVKKTVQYCRKNDISNPVEILRCMQLNMVTGRALEVEFAHEEILGETNFIMVDRQNLLQTALDEISCLQDFRKTLEVQFYDEEAQDYGGPRKEFFSLVLNGIKSNYFDKGLREHMLHDYKTIGIILGLSILQNGKLPTFLTEEMLQAIFSRILPLEPCLKALKNGFKEVGIYQIGCELPMFLHLLRPGPPQTLTVKNLTNLLKPEFSEEGSNSRTFESAVYAKFMKYLREAASGRRAAVSLSNILQFVTGAEEEPVLGFVLHPSLRFVQVTSTFIPTSNTCINCLNLPRPSLDIPLLSEDKLFNLYDFAFSNAFFGHV